MRLISFLGTGNYAETRYMLNDQFLDTCYVAAAIARFVQAEEVSLLATEQAELSHGESISHAFEELRLPKPTIYRIPSGGNTKELWQQFEVIREAVVAGSPEQVAFDITHGFRAQPFFAAAVINYLRTTHDNVPEMQAFYGEWRKDEMTSPVWDISAFINLLDWSSALQDFMTTGHGATLAQLTKRENATIQKSGQRERPRKLAALAESIKAFSENIATVRVPQIITEPAEIRGSAANVLQTIAESEDEVRQHFMPLYPTLKDLKARLADLPADSLFSPEGHHAMLTLAKLYVDFERYPEAAIVIREGWISLYAEGHHSDEEQLSREIREGMEKRWDEAEGAQTNARIADQIRIVRNDIQHGGFKEKSARNPASSLIRDLQGLVEKLEIKVKSV